MKAKYGLGLLVIGFCLEWVGALFKMQHYPYANALLLAGLGGKVAGAGLLLVKLLAHPKIKAFLNR